MARHLHSASIFFFDMFSSGNNSIGRKPSLLSYKRDILNSPVCSPPQSPVFRKSPVSPPSVSPGGSDVPDQECANMSTWQITRRISPSVAAVILTFLVTLTVFPGLIAKIRPASNPSGIAFPKAGRIFGDLWVPILFLTFNVGDTAGRVFSSVMAERSSFTGILAAARVGFIPLLLTVSSHANSEEPLGMWTQLHDIRSVVVVALLSITNGLLGGSAMIHGPSCVPKEFRSRAGTIMAFSMQMGLLLGSVTSFILRAWRCNCNSFLK